MSWYMLPAILALIVKLYIVFFAYRNWGNTRIFFGLVMLFAAQNFTEISLFYNFVNETAADVALRAYYSCTFGVLAYICCYAIDVSRISKLFKLPNILFALSSLAIILVIFTDLIIAGYEPIGYAITRISGAYYSIFQMSALFTIVFSITVLVLGYKRAESGMHAVQNIYSLFALLPFLLAGGGVVIMMAVGYKINAMLILPIASTAFLLITLKTEAKHNLTDIRRILPYSTERKTANKILDLVSDYSLDQKDYRETMSDIESEFVKYKHTKLGYNVLKTAKAMNIPRSSLYSIFRRLGIKHSSDSEQ